MEIYDFALIWSICPNELFTNTLIADCRQKQLSFLWVHEGNVEEITRKLETSEMKIRVALDIQATYYKPQDTYARVCYAVKDAGGVVINDPDRARFAVDKSVMYFEVLNTGIITPYTVIVRNWEPNNFKLTEEERNGLGVPFVIKPGCGFGQRGVVKEATGSMEEILKAREFDKGDNFLLQEKISPMELDGKRAWFRIFHVFHEIIPCWWDDNVSWCEQVSAEEFNRYHLAPLAKIIARIAEMTGMIWFSTEVAIDTKNDQTRFVAIDYVNDQCDMTAQSETPIGIPDDIVKFTAYSIVHAAYRWISLKEERPQKKYTILLKGGNQVRPRGLGYSPGFVSQMLPEYYKGTRPGCAVGK